MSMSLFRATCKIESKHIRACMTILSILDSLWKIESDEPDFIYMREVVIFSSAYF
jgi:hypothetical protein